MKKLVICLLLSATNYLSATGFQIMADTSYLSSLRNELETKWPNNKTVNFVFHGHSVPAGYWDTPVVNPLNSYPNIVFERVKELYPHAVINIIVTAIGGENSEKGQARFQSEVLNHRPDVLFIDYALNDVGLGLDRARQAWEKMIEEALLANVKIILLTPSPDQRQNILEADNTLVQHADQIRKLAAKYQLGLADPFAVFQQLQRQEGHLKKYMSHVNHPNREGHEIIAAKIMEWIGRRDSQ